MYSYKESIEKSTEDLLTFSCYELLCIGETMGLPTHADRQFLAENIATRLVDQHYQQANMNGDDDDNDLFQAVEKGDIKALEELIAAGVDINARDNGDTALLIAIKRGAPPEITDALVKAGGELSESDLPYEGDIRKAVQAQDRPAIRLIQFWNAAHEVERRKELIKEEEEREIPEAAKNCSNERDFISRDYWSDDSLPEIKLTLYDKGDVLHGPRQTLCFEKKSLKRWLDDPANVMARWLPNVKGAGMDDDGHGLPGSHGAGPSIHEIYTLLPDGNTFVPNDRVLLGILQPAKDQHEFMGIPVATDIRLGNRAGSFRQSKLHGQAPGKVIYTIVPNDSNLQQVLVGYLSDNITERGGYPILFEFDSGVSKQEFDEIFNKAIEENIGYSGWEQLLDFSSHMALLSLKEKAEYRDEVDEFEGAVNYESEEKAREVLQEIFRKLVVDRAGREEAMMLPADNVQEAYDAIGNEFYPDWIDDEAIVLLEDLTIPQLVKNLQHILNTHPLDGSYNPAGIRVGSPRQSTALYQRTPPSAMEQAASSGHQATIQWLIDAQVISDPHEDALQLAASQGNLDVVQWLSRQAVSDTHDEEDEEEAHTPSPQSPSSPIQPRVLFQEEE